MFFDFTTAGFYTTGTITFENGKMISNEKVKGNDEGVTEVKGVAEILPDGRLPSSSMFLKNGAWIKGVEIDYVEDPSAQILFK
jgi:hypothetical protein